MNRWALTWAGCAACLAAGCGPAPLGDPADFVQPTVAVMKFENRAPFPLGWKLGDGMADILVDRLVATGRFHVVERPELGSILKELRLQNSGMTRRQRRAAVGQIKNVQYLIKGTVTDFGHVMTTRGWFSGPAVSASGSHARAVMGMTFYVVDVESGEIVHSNKLEEWVSASDVAVKGRYADVAMGGSVFYQTPLGRATGKVMDRAVRLIVESIAARRWQPKIAAVEGQAGAPAPVGETVLLNGGLNRNVLIGEIYEVLQAGARVLDPETGDVLGYRPSTVVGLVRVREVRDRFSIAEVIEGHAVNFHPGQNCRPAQQPGIPGAADPASEASGPGGP